MSRFLALALLIPAFAQPPAPQPAVDSRARLEQVADQRTAEWDTLAKGLEAKIARMLPCDPRVRAALEDVSRASDARMAAVSRYLESAAAQAKADAGRARKALADEQAAVQEIDTERVEAEQERAAIDGQISNLAESAKRREALDDAGKKLAEIRAKVDERVTRAQQEAAHRAALIASLQQLAAGYATRERAIAGELSSLAAERTRWSEYYLARLARAQTECSITNQSAPPRKKP